jgi:hypothetical protein
LLLDAGKSIHTKMLCCAPRLHIHDHVYVIDGCAWVIGGNVNLVDDRLAHWNLTSASLLGEVILRCNDYDNLAPIGMLLDHKVDVNQQWGRSLTPLCIAAAKHSLDCCKVPIILTF